MATMTTDAPLPASDMAGTHERLSSRRHRLGAAVGVLLATLWPALASAQQHPATSADDVIGRPMLLILLLGVVSLLPFAFMILTAFVKISTVLQIVRGAIGAQNVPSSTVVMALSAVLTVVAMAPLGSRIAERAAPLLANQAADTPTLLAGLYHAVEEPLGSFLRVNAAEREKTRFYEVVRRARPAAERDRVTRDDWVVVVPAFVVTELSVAFAVGFAIYLPFLVIDLVVANVLLALGMQMMNPVQVSLPFKLLLFVAVDGWGLLAQALVSGYKLA